MKKIFKTNILTPVSAEETKLLTNVFITVSKTKIIEISKEKPDTKYADFTNCICIPGLIDTHVHLSQFNAIGKHRPNLLDWLNDFIFAEEYKSKDETYARKVAADFFTESVKSGTTTSVIYTAPFKQACEAAFEVAEEFGVRALIGKTMMDQNSPEFLQEDTFKSFKESVELYNKYNSSCPLLEYIFSPRFAPVCSPKLMKLVGGFAKENNAYIQTHLSENTDELKWVKELFPECNSYTQVYEKYNILGEKTILGHAIHLSKKELQIIFGTNSKIAHCPDSNFFLRSGILPLEKIKNSNIDFALASDVAAGTSLSMFNVMKMFVYRQDDVAVTPEEAFYSATLGGAKLLGKEDILGSVEVGKEADLVFIQIQNIKEKTKTGILSELVYLGSQKIIENVVIAGKSVLKINLDL